MLYILVHSSWDDWNIHGVFTSNCLAKEYQEQLEKNGMKRFIMQAEENKFYDHGIAP